MRGAANTALFLFLQSKGVIHADTFSDSFIMLSANA